MTVIQINCLYKFRNPLLVSFHFIFFFSIIPQTTKNSTNSAGKDSLN